MRLDLADDEEMDPRVWSGAIVMGLGIATFLAGTGVASAAAAKRASLDCPEDKCPPELHDDADDFNALRTPAGLTMGAGALVTAVGSVFLYVGLNDQTDMSLVIGPELTGVRGSF